MIKQPIVTTVSSTKDPDYFPHSGTALAVRLLADRVNWLSVVDTLLPWDRARSRIAPSVLLLMLVINVLTHRNPLYGVESWAATLPLPLLWGENIQASQFNDDALGCVFRSQLTGNPESREHLVRKVVNTQSGKSLTPGPENREHPVRKIVNSETEIFRMLFLLYSLRRSLARAGSGIFPPRVAAWPSLAA